MKYLTKSDYLKGLRCLKYLWVSKNDPSKMPQITEDSQFNIDQGNYVGKLATKLFDNGIFVTTDFFQNIDESKKQISKRKPLFESGFVFDRLYARIDILNPSDNNSWDIIEVKATASVKEEHLHDIAFQEYVLRNAGLKINKCFICYLNNQYIRQGDLDIKLLFNLEDVSDKIKLYQENIENNINTFLKVIDSVLPIDSLLSDNCLGGLFSSDCSLKDDCFSILPDHSVFTLSNSRKRIELYNDGIIDLSKFPNTIKLNENQTIQLQAVKHNKVIINKSPIKEFLSNFKYPLYFLDFETFNLAVPVYDNLKPFQRYAFQYSLHVLESKDSEIKHISFLGDENKDCRLDFLNSLIDNLKNSGSIIVYNASFELGVMKELMIIYPEFAERLKLIFNRVVDLAIPFKNFWYYNPLQKGSYSIKKVLPCLTDFSYAELDISNGSMASINYAYISQGEFNTQIKPSKEETKRIRLNLEKYCELDTYAMYLILIELEKMIE